MVIRCCYVDLTQKVLKLYLFCKAPHDETLHADRALGVMSALWSNRDSRVNEAELTLTLT